MIGYILHRIAVMIPTLVIISALVFTIIELPPGDYFETYVAQLQAQGESVDLRQIEFLRQQYGFDRPPIERYFVWVWGMLHGDFGYSFAYELPVRDVVGDRIWLTILVSFVTIIFTWVIAFPIGIYSATHQYSWGDHGLTFLGLIGLATPNFLLALLFMYFANQWFGTSIGGLMDQQYINEPMSWAKFMSVLEHLWIPVIIIGTSGTAGMIRRLRANLLDELQKQYVVTAKAKGWRPPRPCSSTRCACRSTSSSPTSARSCRRSSPAPRSRPSCCRCRPRGRCSSPRCAPRTCISPARS
jgi:peptide/nickel transport system permease protein